MMETVKNPNNHSKIDENSEEKYETAIVHNAILKIRTLMGMIFGQRGSNLIHSCIFNKNEFQDKFLEHRGKKFGIYGICKIKHFYEISLQLDSETIKFANDIANVVHSSVYIYGGSAVKNLTDGFIVSWHLPEDVEKKLRN